MIKLKSLIFDNLAKVNQVGLKSNWRGGDLEPCLQWFYIACLTYMSRAILLTQTRGRYSGYGGEPLFSRFMFNAFIKSP